MDPAFALLIVFLVYSILLGVCLARMRSVGKEIDDLKQVVTLVGTMQQSSPVDSKLVQTNQQLTPELLRALESLAGHSDE